MSLFSKKDRWRKVILTTELMDWKDLDALAWDTADRACDTWQIPLFFSRYSDPATGSQRIEIQMRTDFPDSVLEAFFSGQSGVAHVEVVGSGGSDAHAAAYATARLLRGKGEELTKDVMHWMLNMTGYSYAQEVRIMCEQAAHMAGNMERTERGLR